MSETAADTARLKPTALPGLARIWSFSLRNLPSWLRRLPPESLPPTLLFLGAMLYLVVSGGGNRAGARPWPTDSARPRNLIGSLTSVVGLAVIGVGLSAVVRGRLDGEPELGGTGVLIAAVGQFVLLLGLVLLAASGPRGFGRRPDGVANDPATGKGRAFRNGLTEATGLVWPAATSAATGATPQQILRLNRQLAAVARQLSRLQNQGNNQELAGKTGGDGSGSRE